MGNQCDPGQSQDKTEWNIGNLEHGLNITCWERAGGLLIALRVTDKVK